MATSSWPEVADHAVSRLPVEILAWGFWLLLAAVVIAALSFVRKLLSPPATAQEIADELIRRGWSSSSGAPSLKQLQEAVHAGVNGTAERVKRVEDTLTQQDKRLDAMELILARVDERIKNIQGRAYSETREGDTGFIVNRRKPLRP